MAKKRPPKTPRAKQPSQREASAPSGKGNVAGASKLRLESPELGQSLCARMGQLVGQPIRSEMDLVVMVTTGLPAKSVGTLKQAVELDTELVAPETTLRRRIQEKRPLSTDESERMIRIARITSLAERLFDDRELAHAWMNAPARYIDGAEPITPMALSATDPGARLLESIILRTEYGMF